MIAERAFNPHTSTQCPDHNIWCRTPTPLPPVGYISRRTRLVDPAARRSWSPLVPIEPESGDGR